MMTSSFASTGLPATFILRHHLKPGDLGHLISLHGTVCVREHGFDPTFEANVAGALAEFVQSWNEGDRLWIAECDGRIVGCIAIAGLSPKDAQLRWFLVDPPAREKGLDRRLLDEAVVFCASRGYEYLFLWTVRGWEGSQLYRSFGFEKVQEKASERWGIAVIEERYVLHPAGRPF